MGFLVETRASDSPFVETVWRAQCERVGSFTSIAKSYWEMVVSRLDGKLRLYVRGPETKATRMDITTDAEYVGIRFKLGSYLPHFPTVSRVDGLVILPEATSQSFWLHGSAWQFPNYDNAQVFIDRLVRAGLLVREPVVDEALQGQMTGLSLRTVQRRFLRAIGLTLGSIVQKELEHAKDHQ
ncbi:MAG: helix-turn-helix domain-containing protein [Anaerolineales bacterium]